LPGDGQAKNIAEERNGFIKPISSDSDKTHVRHRRRLLLNSAFSGATLWSKARSPQHESTSRFRD
jgi:hypothetical protein